MSILDSNPLCLASQSDPHCLFSRLILALLPSAGGKFHKTGEGGGGLSACPHHSNQRGRGCSAYYTSLLPLLSLQIHVALPLWPSKSHHFQFHSFLNPAPYPFAPTASVTLNLPLTPSHLCIIPSAMNMSHHLIKWTSRVRTLEKNPLDHFLGQKRNHLLLNDLTVKITHFYIIELWKKFWPLNIYRYSQILVDKDIF